ncbi:ABC transporter permease [Candidatus Parcubacteria bacterium]|nr:ABC transporter permease [Candidatus Parcubacteria bacterium]
MFLESVKNGIIALKVNKIRTVLTVLGIVVGIASVIIVYSAGEGINSLIVGQIESFGGSDMVETEIKVPSSKKGGEAETQSAINLVMGAQVTTLTLDDMEDINKLALIEDSYAGIIGQEQVSYGNEAYRAMLFGVSASYIKLDKSEVGAGRFFTDAEDKSLSQVVVLGQKIKDKLFGETDPIGKSIKLRKKKFKVIGVLKERGAVMTFDFDDIVYLPVRTLQKKVMGINHVLYMMHKVSDTDRLDEVAEDMRYLLRENHDIPQPAEKQTGVFDTGKDDFRVVSMVESMEIMDTVTGAITLLLLVIVAISLVVGGVGIMNIMYVAVTERTAEIGLRKAVGATYADIMTQFLVESVLVTVLGGMFGVIIGIILSWMIAFGANYAGLDWKFIVPLKAYIVALGFSTFFGIVFGLYPARKAARMDPIEALRKE